jgi:hypothetical protein
MTIPRILEVVRYVFDCVIVGYLVGYLTGVNRPVSVEVCRKS